MDDSMSATKSNLLIDFFKAWLYILFYAFKGLRFVLLDMWILLFQNLSFASAKDKKEQQNVQESYSKTRLSKPKRQKQYKYSKKTLEKYEKMKIALNNELQSTGAVRNKVANVYKFTVRNVKGDGRIFSDTMSGFSKLDINSFLVNEGYEVYDIQSSKMINFLYQDSSLLGGKIKTKDLIFWLTQLATYLKAGITLNEAVRILALQMQSSRKKQRMFQSISYELSLGSAFSDALQKQGNYFPALLINMIKAAEAAGTLQETLDDMAKYYSEVESTRKEMVSALTYPVIITIFSIAVITFIIIYVVPQFTKIYEQSNIEIKGITAFIVSFSSFLQTHIMLILLIIVLLAIAFIFAYKKITAFKTAVQITLMHIPVIRDVIIFKEINIFAKTFASLLRNNVFITESMDILSKITENEVYKAIMSQTIDNIIKGEKISDAFADHWAVPDVAYYMIVTGESTGQLADMMQKVSDYYQDMHKSIVNTLKSFIEPVMIVMLAVMVAIIILAVIVPMFSMYNQIL